MKAFISLVLLLITQTAFAESLRFKFLNAQDGLPQNTVRAISQDQNGLMWFATEDGIARYDGQNLKAYRHNPNTKFPLRENVVNRFLVKDQQLWIGTQGEGGVAVLDQKKQEFHPLKDIPNANAESALGNVVFALYERSKDEILVGSENGVFSVSSNQLAINQQLISKRQLENKRGISAIWESPDKDLWVASADGQLAYLDSTNKLNLVENDADSIAHFKRIPALGDLLVADGDLMKLDYTNKRLTPMFSDTFLSNMDVRDIVESPDGHVWIATRSGLLRYEPSTGTAQLASKNSDDENSLPTNDLKTLFMSDEGILWIGTSDKGVVYTNIKGFGFTSYSTHNLKTIHPKPTDPNKFNSFKNNMTWSIFRDSRDTLWIGHSEGLDRQEKEEQIYTHLPTLGKGADAVDISESWLMSITEANGYLWFGTWGEGLLRYHPQSEEVVVYSSDTENPKYKLSGKVIRLLLFDEAKNVLWVGTHNNGLNRINFNTGETSTFLHDPNDEHSFPHHRTRALHLDTQGLLWVGTGNGVALFDDTTQQFKRVKQFPNGEATSDIRGLYRSDNDTLWSATGTGLDRINIKSMQAEKKYREEDGLSRSTLYGIVPDNEGSLWIPTARGLTKFNPQEKSFKRFFIGHNLQANEFNFNAYFKEENGSLIMGGVSGITKFNPPDIKDITTSYEPVILGIKSVDDNFQPKRVLGITKKSTDKKNAVILSSDQRTIIINFVIPEYTFADKLRYEYQLIGSQNQWLTAKPRHTPIRYTNLKAGHYTFQVRNANKSDTQGEPLSVHIIIEKYLWEKWWFRTIFLILFGLLGLYSFRYIAAARLEKNMAQERAELYGMVVHDLGPPLKRIQQDLLALRKLDGNNTHDSNELLNGLDADNQYSLAFINQLRSISSVEGFFEKRKHHFLLEDIVDEAMNHFRQDRDRIEIQNIPDTSVRVYENSIEFILINLISNALKYSASDTSVIVNIKQLKTHSIEISVADNGIGISDAFKSSVFKPHERGDYYKTEGLGIGLTLVKSIVQKYHGEVSVNNNKPKGTVMLVTLKSIVVSE